MIVTIPWTPRAKGRPRMTKGGHTYTPPETRKAEEAIRAAYREAVGEKLPMAMPLSVSIRMSNTEVEIQIEPAEDYESRKLRGDVDNYGKLILDALNGVAWVDDRQIVNLGLAKR